MLCFLVISAADSGCCVAGPATWLLLSLPSFVISDESARMISNLPLTVDQPLFRNRPLLELPNGGERTSLPIQPICADMLGSVHHRVQRHEPQKLVQLAALLAPLEDAFVQL